MFYLQVSGSSLLTTSSRIPLCTISPGLFYFLFAVFSLLAAAFINLSFNLLSSNGPALNELSMLVGTLD